MSAKPEPSRPLERGFQLMPAPAAPACRMMASFVWMKWAKEIRGPSMPEATTSGKTFCWVRSRGGSRKWSWAFRPWSRMSPKKKRQ